MSEKFALWPLLLGSYLKRDWKKILVWVIGLGLFAAALVPVFEEMAKEEGLVGMYEVLANPAMVYMVGPTPIESALDYTLGAMYAHEMLLFTGLFAMIISILHVIAHSRREEDQGLVELLRALPVCPLASPLALFLEIILINLLLMIFIALVMMSFGADTIDGVGSVIFAGSIALAGIMAGAWALFFAQVMPSSSSATAASMGFLGLMYLVRGATDVSAPEFSGWIPMAWTYLAYPFTENNVWPLLVGLGFCLGLFVLALYLALGRDLGASYIGEREGKKQARVWLMSVPGLVFYLNRGAIIAWQLTFFVLGAAYGSIYGDMDSFIESNEMMKQMFTYSGVTIEESFTATLMVVMVAMSAILPVLIINRLYSEERGMYLSQLYATRISRMQVYWTSIVLAIIMGALAVALSALGLGGVAVSVMVDPVMTMTDYFAYGFNLLPSVLIYIGLAGLLLGFVPSFGKFVYVYIVYSFFLDYFKGILNLPTWLMKTSPQAWLAQMPYESFDLGAFFGLSLLGFVMMALGALGYRSRDLREGA